MHARLSRLHEPLAGLAAPRRFQLVLLLRSGVERSVTQLAGEVGLSQSCTTRHLQALARAGLVERVRDGKRVVFTLAPRDAAASSVLGSLPFRDGAPGTRVSQRRARAVGRVGPSRGSGARSDRGAAKPAPGARAGSRRPAKPSVRRGPSGRPDPAPALELAAGVRATASGTTGSSARDSGATASRAPASWSTDSHAERESGNTSAPATATEPAWRRSDIDADRL